MQAATKAAGSQSAAAAEKSPEASSSKLPNAKISNRNLWQILIGHSALRDPDLIQAEVSACSDRLREGLAHYRAPSAASEKKLKESNRVKGKKLAFVLAVSKQLHLDQLQSLELFQGFHYDAYRGSIADLKTKLGSKRETQRLLQQITEYYYSERLFVLRCLKHLLGYWQDSRHPYRGAYAACVEEMNKDEESLIKGVWKQYAECAKAEFPSTVQSSMQETSWLLHNLREQCELLEIALLYYKDYVHPPSRLLRTAKLFQVLGFGLHQQSRVGLLPRAEAITTHLSHLCTLILVEAMDLDWIYLSIDSPDQIMEHDLLKDAANFKEMENVILEWGSLQCHTPILLAWAVFKFIAPTKTEIEYTRSLGNRALEGGVFSFLRSLLKSPYFTGDRPVAGVCKRLVHTLLSLVVTAFNEESLGNPANLVSIAATTLTHPLLRLQMWEKGTASGVGLLLASAQTRFPLELAPLLDLLLPLAGDSYSAHKVFQLLQETPFYTERFSTHSLGAYIDLGEQEGEWVLTTPRAVYSDVSQRLGCPPLVLPPGVRGTVMAVEGGVPAICWEVGYSAWELFALETGSVLLYPGIGVDSSSHPLVERMAQVARLVTEILKQDWSLAPHLRPITSQYFAIIQKFSPFPNPPSHLLSACLQCLAVMATNESEETWKKLSQTGFLPYLKSSFTDVKSVAVVPGHFGQLLNVWERPRGIYPISMAMLELLLSGMPPSNSLATNEQLACIVFVMREMFAGFHKWRYRNALDKEEICHKLLQLCHNVLSQVHNKDKQKNNGRDFVSHFLLHTVGGQAVLSVLSTGVDEVNRMCSSSHSVSQPILSVESLKLAFSIIDLLLQSKQDQAPTPLEQALATQSIKRSADGISVSSPVHLVAVIASYIHHRDDPLVPAGATRLLTRLAQVAPMSMFACLGQEAVAIRDAYVNRLAASSEDTELKVATLELIRESVSSQPSLVELFLCIRAANKDNKEQAVYVLEPESCLHSILDLINPDIQGPQHPPSLLHASVALLHALWQGRHDAALLALRAHKDFWRHLTNPLFNDVQLDDIQDAEDTSHELLVCSHVMHIVAIETYYVMQNRMDKDLVDVMKEFSRSDRYRIWSECLKSLLPKGADISEPPPSTSVSEKVLGAQYELVQAWRTFLLVASSYQESVFDLLDCSLRAQLLADTLEALESQLAAPLQGDTVPMATQLSLLYMVLFKKWSIDADLKLSGSTVSHFCGLLQHASRLDPGLTSQLYIHCFSTLLLLLRVARNRREHLEPRFLLGLVPYLAEVIQNHHFYLKMENRPEPLAVYLLGELVQSLPDPALWLPSLKQHSVVAMLMRLLDEHLRLKTEEGLIEAILSCFLSFSRTTAGAEALVVNGVNQVLCVSMADALLAKLEPAVQEKQLNGSAHLLPPLEWCRSWQLALKLAASLVGSLGHRIVPQALDFTGVYQERLLKALDIFETIHDLQSLEQTLASCQFIQQLAGYRQQWQFSLPALHGAAIERMVYLVNSVVAILGKRATLKHIIKTMNASGVLPPDCGPALTRRRRVSTTSQSDLDDSWVTSSPAFAQLQDRLLLTLKSCLAALKHYTPSLDAMITDGALDLHEYPPLFTLSLSPPMVDCATPPSLGTLTACLSMGLALMNKLDPHRVGTPSRSPSKSPAHPRTIANAQKRADLLCLLEHAVILLLSQATRYLVDSSVESHDKQVLKKELANELGNFSQGLLLNFTRKGAPSPGGSAMRLSTPGGSLSMLDTSSGKASSLSFSDSSEQGIFRLADSFAKQFFR